MSSEIAHLHARARRMQTPCGAGHMVWHRWGETGPDLVLLHGGAGSWMHFVRNIPAFAGRFRVWVPDLPGMGESDQPPEPWDAMSMAGLLEDGIRRLAGPQPVNVLGFSFGALIAGHWAARHPQTLSRLLMVAPAGTALASPPLEAMRSWRKEPDPQVRLQIHRENLQAWMLHDPAAADDTAAEAAQYSVERDRLRNREVSTTDALLRVLPEVRTTMAALYGCEDALYCDNRIVVTTALGRVGITDVTWLPQAGHWACFEQPAAFNAWALQRLA